MSKYMFVFGWARVAEMSYEDCILAPVMVPVVVAKRNDGVVVAWHEALTHAEILLCTKSTNLFNLEGIQEWALSSDNCSYEKVTEGFDVAIPGDSLKSSVKLAKKQLADLLRYKPTGCLVEIIDLINTYRELLPRKLVRKALAAIPAKTVESWDVLYFKPVELENSRIKGKKQHVYSAESFIEWEDVETVENKKRFPIACKLPSPKWEEGERPESHEGNSKSKQKWIRSGKEARKRANRNR